MQVCATCSGSGKTECGHCKGSGRLVRYPEVLRRFDTRIGTRTLTLDERVARWVPEEALARTPGEIAWIGPLEEATSASTAPAAVPNDVWREATAFASAGQTEANAAEAREEERRVISRRLALVRVPLVHLDYEFAGRRYAVTAYGAAGKERFWAERFPHRWSRVGRFLRAISRDLSESGAEPVSEAKTGVLTTLDEVRARREAQASAEGDNAPREP
jgi:hypothetical protein